MTTMDATRDATSQQELDALARGCGIFDRSHHGHLVLSGEDRARFLHGQVTCAVKDLSPGEGTYGFLATLKGRVEVELVVLATDDELWLDLPPGRAEALQERLAKYVIVDRVEFSEPDMSVLTLLGPTCFEVATKVTGLALEDEGAWHHRAASIGGVSVRWVREPQRSAAAAGTDGVSLWLRPDNAPAVREALRKAGAVEVGQGAFDRLRLEQGRPLWGVDFGEDTFPQETGLEDAVSYTKGCYLGQEVIARIHYRGGVQRHMRRLRLSGPVDEGADLVLDGKSVGRLTSTAPSLSGDEILGLAVIHQRAEVGAELAVRVDDETVATATIL